MRPRVEAVDRQGEERAEARAKRQADVEDAIRYQARRLVDFAAKIAAYMSGIANSCCASNTR